MWTAMACSTLITAIAPAPLVQRVGPVTDLTAELSELPGMVSVSAGNGAASE